MKNRDGYSRTYGIKILRIKNEIIINEIEKSIKSYKRKNNL